jgi:hypothetical protein
VTLLPASAAPATAPSAAPLAAPASTVLKASLAFVRIPPGDLFLPDFLAVTRLPVLLFLLFRDVECLADADFFELVFEADFLPLFFTGTLVGMYTLPLEFGSSTRQRSPIAEEALTLWTCSDELPPGLRKKRRHIKWRASIC